MLAQLRPAGSVNVRVAKPKTIVMPPQARSFFPRGEKRGDETVDFTGGAALAARLGFFAKIFPHMFLNFFF